MPSHNLLPPARIVALGGPVSAALAAMRSDPYAVEVERVRALRAAIAERIAADLELLDALDGDTDFEAVNEDGGDICDEPHEEECDFPAPEWPGDDEHHFTPVRGALPRRAPPASAFLPVGGAA